MEDATLARRILLVGVVAVTLYALTGCASELIVTAGSSICTAQKNSECESLQRIANSLHTPEMEKAIQEARHAQ